MRKFYPAICLLSIIVLLVLSAISSQSTEKQVFWVSSLIEGKNIKSKKRRGYIQSRIGIVSAFADSYFHTVGLHFYRAGLCGCLLLFLGLESLSFPVGVSVFLLSSLATSLQIVACYAKSKAVEKISYWYGIIFSSCYETVAGLMLCTIAVEVATVIISVLYYQVIDELACPLWVIVASNQVTTETGPYVETLNTGDGLKIEQNERCYRITIGPLTWLIEKGNTWNRIVFAVLIYAARTRTRTGHAVTLKDLSRALGWESVCCFYGFYQTYHNAGDSLAALMPYAIDVQLGKIKSKALKIWREDLNLSIEDIECKLQQEGIKATSEQIELALRNVNFNKLLNYLRRDYVRRGTCVAPQPAVRLEFWRKRYRVWLGNFFWDVCATRKSELPILFDWLEQCNRIDGSPVITPKNLREMREKAHEHLFAKLLKFETITGHHPLDHCAQRHQLSEKIWQMWLEDITLSGEKVVAKLIEQGDVETISLSTVCKLVEQVDFMKIRKSLLKDYRQGKYRKSSQWIMQKYRDVIDDLLNQLAQGQQWSKARIEKYIEDMPASLTSPGKKDSTPRAYFTRAWLKCFLFNLPKSQNGAICCRECGSFDTVRKTKVPQPHIVTDPQTGETVTVHTFRFRCRNPRCSVTTFSSTADGSYVLHEDGYAKACTMLRLVMDLGGSYGSVGRIMDIPKSVVFDSLSFIAQMADFWREILGVIRFSGTLCIDEKFVKVAQLKQSKGNRNFAYLFLAVDPQTYDLLHIEIYPCRDQQTVVAFLTALKTQGIFPEVIMTDLFAGYDSAIKDVFGRSVTIAKCHFHFQKNIFKHMHDQFGKKEIPEIAELLQKDIFFVVGAKSKKSIRDRYRDLQQIRGEYLRREPRLLPMFACLDSYLPQLLRVIEHEKVGILTNNACELVIRRFNQRYKTMGGFESLGTVQRHARLFQIYHRFTPFTQDAEQSRRGKAPLQLAGYDIANMPIFHYLTQPLLFNLQPAKNRFLYQKKQA